MITSEDDQLAEAGPGRWKGAPSRPAKTSEPLPNRRHPNFPSIWLLFCMSSRTLRYQGVQASFEYTSCTWPSFVVLYVPHRTRSQFCPSTSALWKANKSDTVVTEMWRGTEMTGLS